MIRVISTSPHCFGTVWVEKEQDPFPNSKSQQKISRYGIIERLPFSPTPEELHQFYHGRQTIEQFFKESTGPFNAGKLPSQKFRGNQAYLQLVTIAENCCVLFKKKVSLPPGKRLQCPPLETV
ncbi:MAG: transposase [Candidatus Poribacteria bacterium]|nr:transposase [Candidatus Poribacteria bacterium]